MELKKILVVDDENSVRNMITVLLQKEQFDASGASSGEEALQILGERPFDLVLCDIRMPGMDGLEVLSTIRSLYPDTTVIMMSAFGTVDLAVEAMKQGAYDYISKPFKTDEILLTLRKAQERESLRRENIMLTGSRSRKSIHWRVLLPGARLWSRSSIRQKKLPSTRAMFS